MKIIRKIMSTSKIVDLPAIHRFFSNIGLIKKDFYDNFLYLYTKQNIVMLIILQLIVFYFIIYI